MARTKIGVQVKVHEGTNVIVDRGWVSDKALEATINAAAQEAIDATKKVRRGELYININVSRQNGSPAV